MGSVPVGNAHELSVETIDVHGRAGNRNPAAPRPVALERAMKTAMDHEECWDEWLNILDPAAARVMKKAGARPAQVPFAPSNMPTPAQLDGGAAQEPAAGSS